MKPVLQIRHTLNNSTLAAITIAAMLTAMLSISW